jgi:hypothetical protein
LTVPVKRRLNKRREEIPDVVRRLLSDEPITDSMEVFFTTYILTDEKRIEAWQALRDGIIADWVQKYPGARPSHWWRYDAPKEPVSVYGGHRHEAAQRRRLGGLGMAKFEVLNNAPKFEFGIPTDWVNRFEVAYYNGRPQRDVNGELLKPQFEEGDFVGVAPDPDDPPVFESEASYLKHHNLLLPGEARLLKKRDFEPEVLEVYVFGEGENPYRPRAPGIGV